MFFKLSPTMRLSRVGNAYRTHRGSAIKRFHDKFQIGSYSKTRRFLVEHPRMNLDESKDFVEVLAPRFGMSVADFIIPLFTDVLPLPPRFAEFALATVIGGTRRRAAKQIQNLITQRLKAARRVTYWSRFIPHWLVPDGSFRAYGNLIGETSHPNLRRHRRCGPTIGVARALRVELVDSCIEERITVVPIMASAVQEIAEGSPPFFRLSPEDRSAIVDEVLYGSPGYGVLPLIVTDTAPEFPKSLREHFGRHEMIIGLDGTTLFKQLLSSGSWLMFERNGDPAMETFIDSELGHLAELHRWIDINPDVIGPHAFVLLERFQQPHGALPGSA